MTRDFLAAATGIVALVLTLLGFGVGLLISGLAIGAARMRTVQKKAMLIARGKRCSGTIQNIEINRRVRVNRQHPSIITYKYRFEGKDYVGSDTVFDFPPDRKPGSVVDIIVSPESPDSSALDPQSLASGGAGKSPAT